MKPKIAVIVASTRPGRIGPSVASWFMEQISGYGKAEFTLLDLAEENLPFLNEPGMPAMAKYENQSTKDWGQKISSFDGFIIVTPEYNHGYAAPLKNAIDTIYREWQKKPVAFVGYGVLGGARAIEQLVQVTAQVGMVPLPYVAINIIDAHSSVGENGGIKPESIKGSKPDRLVEELVWWAKLLSSAK